MKIRTMYICEVCMGEYDSEEAARACEALPPEVPTYEPGTLVCSKRRAAATVGSIEVVEYRREEGYHAIARYRVATPGGVLATVNPEHIEMRRAEAVAFGAE